MRGLLLLYPALKVKPQLSTSVLTVVGNSSSQSGSQLLAGSIGVAFLVAKRRQCLVLVEPLIGRYLNPEHGKLCWGSCKEWMFASLPAHGSSWLIMPHPISPYLTHFPTLEPTTCQGWGYSLTCEALHVACPQSFGRLRCDENVRGIEVLIWRCQCERSCFVPPVLVDNESCLGQSVVLILSLFVCIVLYNMHGGWSFLRIRASTFPAPGIDAFRPFMESSKITKLPPVEAVGDLGCHPMEQCSIFPFYKECLYVYGIGLA